MNIIEDLNWRYATKKFDTAHKLSENQLDILKEAFNLTALSYGLQTLKLIVISDKDKREQLVEHAYGQRQVVDSSHLLILCIQSQIDTDDVEEHFDNVIAVRQTPAEILQPFKNQLTGTISQMETNKKLEWATRQAYIALGNLMTVCAAERIDSCPMEGFNPDSFDTILGLDQRGLKSILLLPVGKRAEDDKFASFKKVRKSLDKTVVEL